MHRGLDFVCIYLAEVQKTSFTVCFLKDAERAAMELRIPGPHQHRRSVSLRGEGCHEGTADLQLPARGKHTPASMMWITELFPNFPAHVEVFSP